MVLFPSQAGLQPGRPDSSYYPAYSSAELNFSFSGKLLRQGTNTITLQAIEETQKIIPGAALVFDAVELDRNTSRDDSETSSAQVQPTIFYQEQKGQLEENVDVFLRFRGPVKAGAPVDLAIGGKSSHQALRGNQDFGE